MIRLGARGLDRALVMRLAGCQWVKARHNVLITGPTGVGKSYLGCALAHKACLQGYSAFYRRLPRLLEELHLAKADGSYGKMLLRLSKIDVLRATMNVKPKDQQTKSLISEVGRSFLSPSVSRQR